MNSFNKFIKKFLPRAGAVVLACVCGLVLFAFNYFVLFEPENNNSDIKFEVPETGKKSTKKNEEPKSDDKSYNFLVMGHDRAASLTDVMMLINYNVEKQNITLLQLPRDTYIEIENYNYHKINGLYNYCVAAARDEGSKDPELDGARKTADWIEENMAMKIHYCAVMDLDGFEGIVDTIGGVDMYVPMNMYYSDPGQNLYINLREGYQHLDGNTAEQFVRYRYGYATGDIGRGDAQKLFISAFIKKLQSSLANADAGMLSGIADNVAKCVKTDVTVADMVYMAKKLVGLGSGDAVKPENISLMTMPGIAQMYNGASYYIINKEYATELVNKHYNIYEFDIATSFDKKERFTTPYNSVISDCYSVPKDSVTLTVYTAGSLEENGLG